MTSSVRRLALRAGFSVALCLVAAEIAARAFWSVSGVPLLHPGLVLYAFYPELRAVDTARPGHGDGRFDVLMLGESVLHRDWGAIEQALAEQLAFDGHHDLRMFNLAKPAQNSRDSLLKYAALADARFDLVIVYDGINETRANNAPPDIFRDDYSHYFWYETVNAMAPYHKTASFALPYTLRFLTIRARQLVANRRYIAMERVRNDWAQYGRDIRSAAAFRTNMRTIVETAARRGDRMLLMTVATYKPGDYSLDAFKAKQLSYGLHLTAFEIWGRPDNVLAAVAAHNAIVRDLAATHPEALFVDQAKLMAGTARFFNDPCHLTVAGSLQFVANMRGALLNGAKPN